MTPSPVEQCANEINGLDGKKLRFSMDETKTVAAIHDFAEQVRRRVLLVTKVEMTETATPQDFLLKRLVIEYAEQQ